MKTEISRDSFQSSKNYSGVYQQQGRMLTDSDWNELVDILKSQVNDALKDVVGDTQGSVGGTPKHRSLAIVEDGGIKIQPGRVFVDGRAATLNGKANIALDAQPDFPDSPLPENNYRLYADVWERSITYLQDIALLDAGLHGADTCTRTEQLVQIKWCPSGIQPETSDANPPKGDAQLSLSVLQKTVSQDTCDPCAVEINDAFVGNYLFRVEVHDVKGAANAPDEITLKWSSENASEQYIAMPTEAELPAGFISDKWIYEFYDQTTERQSGIHLNDTGWSPVRSVLKRFGGNAPSYSVPAIIGSTASQTFVRRWDGYCRINLKSKTLVEGHDKGFALSTSAAEDALGYVDIGTKLLANLDAIQLQLTLSNRRFVAGDYWLAEVRDAVHAEGSVLLSAEQPTGISHRYLMLAQISVNQLVANPEQDRKYNFPALTELTRLSIAGGEGQSMMAEHELPQPLRVNVANGEWPVTGAWLQYEVISGGGELSKPASVAANDFTVISTAQVRVRSLDGQAAVVWRIGSDLSQVVKVTLLGREYQTLEHPPLFFTAQLNEAKQVSYTPQCANVPSVHSLLSADAGLNWPDLDVHGHTSVKHALDTILCQLVANKLPYDPNQRPNCWQDLSLDSSANPPQTVQAALDALVCAQNGCCSMIIEPTDDVAAKLAAIKDGQDADICFKRGNYVLPSGVTLANKGHILIRGVGVSTRLLGSNTETVLKVSACKSITIRDIAIQGTQSSESNRLNGALDIFDTLTVDLTGLTLTCASSVTLRTASCLRVSYGAQDNASSIRIQKCQFNPGHRQTGLLLINANRARIENNEIQVRKKSDKWVLKEQLKNAQYRKGFRNVLISNISLMPGNSETGINRNGSYTYNQQTFYYSMAPDVVSSWQAFVNNEIDDKGMDTYEFMGFLKSLADKILLSEGNDGGTTFVNWYKEMASAIPNIASQGITVGGTCAQDILIANNTIRGVGQGIHIGLSNAGTEANKPELAGRIQIRNNHITTYLSTEYKGERHGVFVGNCHSLDIEANYLWSQKFPGATDREIEGIRCYGFIGKTFLVRNNHLNNFSTGIFARFLATQDKKVWQIVNNMCEGATYLTDVLLADGCLVENNA